MTNDPKKPRFTIPGFSGQDVPFHGITFDKRGKCTSPQTREAILARIRDEGFTDVIFYSHGWNNDWEDATRLYSAFMTGVGTMATDHAGALPDGIKPLVIGIAWPGVALVWPWERTPDMAASPPDVDDLALLTEDMDEADAARLRALVDQTDTLTTAQLGELAALLGPQFAADAATDDAAPEDFAAEDLEHTFRAADEVIAAKPVDDGGGGGFDDAGSVGGGDAGDEAQAAGGALSGLFGARKALRLATVLKMKDRAGIVGRAGVAETLQRILSETSARLHIVGHSYGAMVTMSALSAGDVSRPAASVLLLQPAVNLLAFAPDVNGRPGGFRPALTRSAKPILATHSSDDFPLRRVFHLAVRRKRDLGEVQLAARVPKFGAMGGFGPKNLGAGELTQIDMPAAGTAYPGLGSAEVVDLAATGKVQGHSDVNNDFTFWAMLQNLA